MSLIDSLHRGPTLCSKVALVTADSASPRAEQYAKLVVYLAGDDHYFVGQVLSPNGGFVI